jgi:hypothetical protein
MGQVIETPIAIGELIDKITILEIKVERFADSSKTRNALAELDLLIERRQRGISESERLAELTIQLKTINERLWELEDAIRDCERRVDFGPDFVKFARQIYKTNDQRAAVKRQINLEFDSAIIEEKSYQS